MKSLGIVRRVDSLGRISIPKEMRKVMRIATDDPMEFYADGNMIIIKKYDAVGDMQQLLDNTKNLIQQDDILPRATLDKLLRKVAEMQDILDKSK